MATVIPFQKRCRVALPPAPSPAPDPFTDRLLEGLTHELAALTRNPTDASKLRVALVEGMIQGLTEPEEGGA